MNAKTRSRSSWIIAVPVYCTLCLLILSCSDKEKIINEEFPSVTIEKMVYEEGEDDYSGFYWAVFRSENKRLEKKLNETLSMEAVIGQTYETIQEEMKYYIEEMGMPQGVVYTNFTVNMNDGFILDIEFHEGTMAAYYNYGSYHRQVNLQTGGPLELNDLISEEHYEEIIRISDEHVREQAERIFFESRAYEGFDLHAETGDLEYTENSLDYFTVSPGGITFNYILGLPRYLHALDPGDLGYYFNFYDYGYLAKEGSILESYISNNQEEIASQAEKYKSEQSKIDKPEYLTAGTVSQLREAIRTASDGAVIMIGNDIEINDQLMINRNDITLTGDLVSEPVIYTSDPQLIMMVLESCTNVTVQNLRFRHLTEGATCESGVMDLFNSVNVTIDNCDISGCGTYGLYVAEDCKLVTISDNDIYDCSYVGMILYSAYSTMRNNRFFRNGNGTGDHEIGPGIRGTLTKQDNVYLGWNDDNYLKEEIDLMMQEEDPTFTDEFETPGGGASLIAYTRMDEVIFLELDWNEVVDYFNMKVYFGRRLPVVIEWMYEAADTDAPVSEVYKYTLTSGIDRFDELIIETPYDGGSEYPGEGLTMTMEGFIDALTDIINGEMDMEMVLSERFFDYQGMIQ